jgi:hypothetical protein
MGRHKKIVARKSGRRRKRRQEREKQSVQEAKAAAAANRLLTESRVVTSSGQAGAAITAGCGNHFCSRYMSCRSTNIVQRLRSVVRGGKRIR